jgi:hypothetical protein
MEIRASACHLVAVILGQAASMLQHPVTGGASVLRHQRESPELTWHSVHAPVPHTVARMLPYLSPTHALTPSTSAARLAAPSRLSKVLGQVRTHRGFAKRCMLLLSRPRV